ncbi:Multiple RNA-binding domain-containing protein 1 [Cucumispora dikerogammari]|nr:Multiple RNA-binding domain-containing protein 1 [Cucumispora dikerogammari]
MRIIVKNIPSRLSQQEIHDIFSKYGTITDIFMVKRGDKFNGVCFIGYSKNEYAEKAILQRNATYIKNLKISVSQETKQYKNKNIREDVIERNYIATTNRLTAINLPFNVIEEEVREHFGKYGKIKSLNILKDTSQKVNIVFKHIESVTNCVNENELFMGRRIVLFETPLQTKTYFNSLFFDFKTIVERYKLDIPTININDANLGINTAVLETHLIEETKRFLEANNIFLDNLTGSRSKNILIVRNYNMLNQRLNCKIKIAPSKTLALLYFKTEEEARSFFKEFNLKRVEDKAIYCEFLPNSENPNYIEEKKQFTNKLIIKNIPFQANKYEIKKIFESQVKITKIRLPEKPEGGHRGFGFVICENESDARCIYENFGDTHLYGRKLIIEIAK